MKWTKKNPTKAGWYWVWSPDYAAPRPTERGEGFWWDDFGGFPPSHYSKEPIEMPSPPEE